MILGNIKEVPSHNSYMRRFELDGETINIWSAHVERYSLVNAIFLQICYLKDNFGNCDRVKKYQRFERHLLETLNLI